MAIEIRPITPDEWRPFVKVLDLGFGAASSEEELADWERLFEYERSLAAFDGPAIVGTGGASSLELTLPGDTRIPAGGLTAVAVQPTHRRRGILRALIERHFADCMGRGEAVSLLTASESSIYGRFGYGEATRRCELVIERRHADFLGPPAAGGRIRMVEGDEAGKLLPELFDRNRRAQPGDITRSPVWWELQLRDPEWLRQGAGRRVDVVYEAEPGQAEGYATYRTKPKRTDGLPDATVTVDELVAPTPAAGDALWRFCLSLDLASTIHLHNRPVDEPLRWRLADPRRLRTTQVADMLWARLLDLPAALAARGYGVSDRLVLGVHDPLVRRNEGRWALEVGPEGATCAPARADPDLVCDIVDLGATWLGGVSFTTLARAGRVAETRPGALARADRAFASTPAPWCSTDF